MLSVVVPAYNEEVTVGETIDRIQRALQGSGIPYEVIVVFFVGIIVAIHTSFLVSAAGLLCQAIVSTRGDESKTFKGRKGLEKEKQLVEGKFD